MNGPGGSAPGSVPGSVPGNDDGTGGAGGAGSTGDPQGAVDSGLQGERTRFAWVRTATVLAAGGLGGAGVALRAGAPAGAVLLFVPAVFCAFLLLTQTGIRYRRAQEALRRGGPLDDRADALIAWIGTLAVVAGAAVSVLAGIGR
ncbi:DUF202 domain-containing protein [Streptosporangium sp. NPDC023615]|uniref:DUF202 domain-containing protein n=1 Tax=Streptosporangium sp. NPDC023615 TaxID=3154794 RepID=UPI003432C977